ncbi:MAG: hypothetical protein HRU75_09710 [Planctomycetia bacterium]|nr:MAG: hypothetical protein HRU75_09710 [Planctomycetia bacterium]
MLRGLSTLCAAGLFVGIAIGQEVVAPGAAPTPAPTLVPGKTGATTLRGHTKLRYIGRRLSLTDDQQRKYDELLETYRLTIDAENQDQAAYLTQLKELISQQTQAEQAGDRARADDIRRQINETRPGVRAEREFFLNLEKHLTPEQNELVALLRSHAESPGGVELTTLYVLRTARALELTDEQRRSIDELQRGAFSTMNPLAGQPPARETVRDKLIADIRVLLNPAQQKRFDERIDILRSRPGDEQPTPARPAAPPASGG